MRAGEVSVDTSPQPLEVWAVQRKLLNSGELRRMM